jgi:hypothetical protein
MVKCVELVAVYDDGTVKRWTGRDLDSSSRLDTIVEWPDVDRPLNVSDGVVVRPTITHPLRKVTNVRGKPLREAGRDVLVPVDRGVVTTTTPGPPYELTDLLPDGAAYTRRSDSPAFGKVFDFRITVEAEKVDP